MIDVLSMKDIFQLCRAYGVDSFRMDGMYVKFGKDPNQPVIMPMDEIKQSIGGELSPTEDQLMFWSSDKDLPDIEAQPPES